MNKYLLLAIAAIAYASSACAAVQPGFNTPADKACVAVISGPVHPVTKKSLGYGFIANSVGDRDCRKFHNAVTKQNGLNALQTIFYPYKNPPRIELDFGRVEDSAPKERVNQLLPPGIVIPFKKFYSSGQFRNSLEGFNYALTKLGTVGVEGMRMRNIGAPYYKNIQDYKLIQSNIVGAYWGRYIPPDGKWLDFAYFPQKIQPGRSEKKITRMDFATYAKLEMPAVRDVYIWIDGGSSAFKQYHPNEPSYWPETSTRSFVASPGFGIKVIDFYGTSGNIKVARNFTLWQIRDQMP